jgi:quinol monooxygenase YgiN
MSVTLIYNLQAISGKADALLELLQQGRDFGLTVTGCEAYELHQNQDDPHKFVMIEQWASVEAQQDHFKRNVMDTGMLDQVMPLLVAPPDGVWHVPR